jgi:5'-3' exonuclease
MARTSLSADGVNTGPLMVFINTLSRHVREEDPDRLVVCWDGGRSAFRVALYPEYKANRLQAPDPEFDERKRGTFALAREFLALSGIHQIDRPGFEADDLISWYVHHRPAGERAVILSSDKDFLQLLCDEVEQVRLSSGGADTDRWTVQRVREEHGCEPEHLALAMALAGDISDGVPGVPRFGMKTALKNLAKSGWSLDAVEHPAVREHWGQVQVALRLVDLRTPPEGLALPELPMFEPTDPSSAMYEGLLSFLTRYRLESVRQRLYVGGLWKEGTPV